MKTKLIVLLPFLLLGGVVWGQGCFLGVGATSINNTINTSGNAIVDQVDMQTKIGVLVKLHFYN